MAGGGGEPVQLACLPCCRPAFLPGLLCCCAGASTDAACRLGSQGLQGRTSHFVCLLSAELAPVLSAQVPCEAGQLILVCQQHAAVRNLKLKAMFYARALTADAPQQPSVSSKMRPLADLQGPRCSQAVPLTDSNAARKHTRNTDQHGATPRGIPCERLRSTQPEAQLQRCYHSCPKQCAAAAAPHCC